MSWDVLIMRLPAEIRTYDDLESYGGDPMLPLGRRADVIRQISAVFEGTDWSDPAWGIWSGREGSIEFNLGDDDEIESVMLHVRADDAIVARIVRLVTACDWRALDTTTTGFLVAPSDTAGVSSWRAFRDRVLRRGDPGDRTRRRSLDEKEMD